MNEGAFIVLDTKVMDGEITYNGVELRSHFIRDRAGLEGDAVIAFSGPCDVSGRHLVDLEDREQGDIIKAASMLHFIGEHFQCPLREMNLRLRLFAALVREELEKSVPGLHPFRRGDDLYLEERKLSVAIATASPVSSVFHFGLNIDQAGAPVPAAGLKELGIDAPSFAAGVLARYREECIAVERALRKVRGVP